MLDQNHLIGTYEIVGENQSESPSTYTGTLELSINEDNRIVALWTISDSQLQQGVGFYKDNVLVINFQYVGGEGRIFKGTVVYKCLSKDVLEGFWSEEDGDHQYLGKEQAYRSGKPSEILN